MKAYISISRINRQALDKELSAIKTTLLKLNFDPLVFFDNCTFDVSQERKMMKQAMADIDRCDLLIAETSNKAIGVGKCRPFNDYFGYQRFSNHLSRHTRPGKAIGRHIN